MKYEWGELDDLKNFIVENRNKILIVLFLSVGLTLIAFGIKTITSPYIKEDGKLMAIEFPKGLMEGKDGIYSVPVKVVGEKDGKKIREEIVIQMGKGDNKGKKDVLKDDEEEDLKRKIRETASAVGKRENLYGDQAQLPEKLKDGTLLTWEEPSDRKQLIFLGAAPLYAAWIYMSEREKKKKERDNLTKTVLKSLPDFNNRLVLLLGSGLIFEDAIIKVAEGYEKAATENFFASMITGVVRDGKKTRRDVSSLLADRAMELNIREFSRITGIIEDNRKSGVDLRNKLKEEGELLWDMRRKQAEEEGNLMEIKLSFPLAILLIVLIVITGAPALLQMH